MVPDRSPQEWRPTARWQAGRILKLAGSIAFIGLWAAFAFGGTGDGGFLGWLSGHFFTVWLAGAVLAVGGMVLWRRHAHRRRSALERLARERGWQLTERGFGRGLLALLGSGSQFTDRWSWPPLRRGRITNLLIGEFDGFAFAEFDYQVKRGRDDRSETFGVTTIRLPAALPRLQVTPEHIASALVPGLRFRDVDVESEAFNRRYRVQVEDRRYAVDVLNQRTVAELLSTEPFRWRIDGPDLIAFGTPLAGREQILDRLRILAAIAHNIPSFVWQDRGQPAAG